MWKALMWNAKQVRSRRLYGVALAAIFASGWLAAACGDGTGPSKSIAAIVIDPPTAPRRVVAPDATIQLSAVALDSAGGVVDATFTWASSNVAVATVSNTGLVTGKALGVVTITASAGGKTGSVMVIVSVPGTQIVVEPATAFLDVGGTLQLTARVLDAQGNTLELPVTFTSENQAVVTSTTAGFLTGVSAGTATITAASGEARGAATITVEAPVATITIEPELVEISVDETIQLVATPKDASGQALNRPVTWTSSNTAVATVDDQGNVTGKSTGTVTISAAAGGKQGNKSVSVQPKPAAITVARASGGSGPIEIGATVQLTATVTDAAGTVIDRRVTWTSSSDAIASVDANGLVTGVGGGTAIITATVQQVTGTIEIRVNGGDTETTGNNLSWPVVFAEGVGLTGAPVATDPGVRPLSTEIDAYAEYVAIAPTNPSAAFFFTGNVPNCGETYYCQGTVDTWRAQIVDGTGQPAYDASIYWGDNVAGGTGNLGVGHPIRVEVALSTTDGVTLQGFNMPYVVNASSPDEIQGTDGTQVAEIPLIYSGGATLTIEQLSGPGGSVVATVSSGEYKAEINVGGRIIYGSQFKPTVAGTYRLRFILASGANTRITAIGNATGNITIVNPSESAIEITVTE